MIIDFLKPVSKAVIAHAKMQEHQALGNIVEFHTEDEFPEIQKGTLVVLGVLENRNDVNYFGEELSFDGIRKSFYELFPGNWMQNIVDIGDIQKGASVSDTYFATKEVVHNILKLGAFPIVLGGSNDLVYSVYRGYDNLDQLVSLVSVDAKFDLKDATDGIKNNNYLNSIIVEEPNNLINFTNIGFQTFYNSQEEIDLMERLYFEAYRLGEITKALHMVEPITRNADMMSFDVTAIRASELSTGRGYRSPNGFDGKEACAIARYAGLSNSMSTFSIMELNNQLSEAGEMLIAQVVWYYIEGIHCRIEEASFVKKEEFTKYNVMLEDCDLVFYKSLKSNRWWVKTPGADTKIKSNTLLACTYDDYKEACNGEIPERIFKAFRKNLI